MQKYVLGFAFSEDKNQILLIKKNRPVWQNGLLNGIGGKVENSDSNSLQAIVREFKEETDIQTLDEQWSYFATIESDEKKEFQFKIDIFCLVTDDVYTFKSITDETVDLYFISDLYMNMFQSCMSNLAWLIPMSLEHMRESLYSKTLYL